MINLLYSGNAAMLEGILSSAISIALKTPSSLHIHILTGDFSDKDPRYTPFLEEEREFLEKCLTFYNKDSKVTVYNLDEKYLDEVRKGKNYHNRFSPYAMLRLFINEDMLKCKRVLYLDTDVLALRDISSFYNLDLRGNYVAMVEDAVGSIWLSPKYCNSGVILFDLEAISRTNILALCRKMVFSKKMWMPDQSAINTYFEDKKLYLPRRYNEQKKTQVDTILRHFCDVMHLLPYLKVVRVKQWDVERVHSVLHEHEFDFVLNMLQPLMEAFKEKADPSAILLTNYTDGKTKRVEK